MADYKTSEGKRWLDQNHRWSLIILLRLNSLYYSAVILRDISGSIEKQTIRITFVGEESMFQNFNILYDLTILG